MRHLLIISAAASVLTAGAALAQAPAPSALCRIGSYRRRRAGY